MGRFASKIALVTAVLLLGVFAWYAMQYAMITGCGDQYEESCGDQWHWVPWD